MSVISIANRYASAFNDVVKEKGLSQIVIEDVRFINNTLNHSKEIKTILKSPIIKQDKKLAILKELFSNKIKKETDDFISFIISKNRESLLAQITQSYIEIFDKENGFIVADLISAFDIDEPQLKTIIQKIESITNKKVRLNIKIKPDLIGGFQLRIKDTIYDASVKRQLELLKKQLLITI